MGEIVRFEGATETTGCVIPASDANRPLALAVADELPVVLRDQVTNRRHFEAFGCEVPKGAPETPDRVEPDVTFVRQVHDGGEVTMEDGRVVEFFGFWDPVNSSEDKDFPSPMMRCREGQVVHTTLIPDKNTHTIHHHGIEPTPHNDGVGHTSFEVVQRASYTYQWRASNAGTYFYHCHKNTTLHFELGMYGPLVVDPPEGEGFFRHGDRVEGYDHEVLWIPDDVDPHWHELHHKAGMECPWDDTQPMLRFDPTYFLISGVPSHRTRSDRSVRVDCRVGDRVLVRLLNAAYGVARIVLPFDATVVNRDGHALGHGKDFRYSWPYPLPAGTPLTLTTAQRVDLLVVPDRPGTAVVDIEILHWVRGTVNGRVQTEFRVR